MTIPSRLIAINKLTLDDILSSWPHLETQAEKIRLISKLMCEEDFQCMINNLDNLLGIGEKNREILELLTTCFKFR